MKSWWERSVITVRKSKLEAKDPFICLSSLMLNDKKSSLVKLCFSPIKCSFSLSLSLAEKREKWTDVNNLSNTLKATHIQRAASATFYGSTAQIEASWAAPHLLIQACKHVWSGCSSGCRAGHMLLRRLVVRSLVAPVYVPNILEVL